MSLTLRQKALIHIVVQRFDRETQTTKLEAEPLAAELMADPQGLSEDIDVLVSEGYVERLSVTDDGQGAGGPEGVVWVLNPTDRAVMAAMGLE
jgi:hypothetical protein